MDAFFSRLPNAQQLAEAASSKMTVKVLFVTEYSPFPLSESASIVLTLNQHGPDMSYYVSMEILLPVIGTSEQYGIAPSKIIAVGLNYRAHVAESESVKVQGFTEDVPPEPVLFNKTPNVLIGPGQCIPLPAAAEESFGKNARTDLEGELVVLIGRRGKNIPESEALEYVRGYTCGNDVSQRNIQNADKSGWFRGKSFDGFGPVGPALLPAGGEVDPQNFNIQTRLNGKVVQNSNTGAMIFPVARLIAYISRQFTLEEGDLIFTGTPAGVSPLAPGDVVEVEIEGIGVLKNTVSRESMDSRNI